MIGQMLLDTNVASVNARYSQDELLAYTYEPPRYRWEPVELLKAIAGYEYQACEAPAWESSLAREFCDQLRKLCISALPGYEEGPWAIAASTMPERLTL